MNENTALIIVDMQENYIGKKSKYNYYSLELIDSINERINIGLKQNELIIYVRNINKKNKEVYISPLTEKLNVVSKNIIDKNKGSAFSNMNFLNLLKQNKIQNIDIVGIDGNCCVATTAIDASKLGFFVKICLKYIGVKDKNRFDKTKNKLTKFNISIIE